MVKITSAAPLIKKLLKTILVTLTVLGVLIGVVWIVSYINYLKVKNEIFQPVLSLSVLNQPSTENIAANSQTANKPGGIGKQQIIDEIVNSSNVDSKKYEVWKLNEKYPEIIVAYYDDYDDEKAGILMFVKKSGYWFLKWEGKEGIRTQATLRIQLQDLNNDSIQELIIDQAPYSHYEYHELLIFDWDQGQDSFKLMPVPNYSPVPGYYPDQKEVSFRGTYIDIQDRDKDNFYEIYVQQNIMRRLGENEKRSDKSYDRMDYTLIYKWNGSAYYLDKQTAQEKRLRFVEATRYVNLDNDPQEEKLEHYAIIEGPEGDEWLEISKYENNDWQVVVEMEDFHLSIASSTNIMVRDINQDHFKEIIISDVTEKLLETKVYTFRDKKLFSLVFKDGDKEVEIWSEKEPEFIDISRDGTDEVIITHFLKGKVLTEAVIVKEYFRWNGEYYEKYNEEINTEDSGFQG